MRNWKGNLGRLSAALLAVAMVLALLAPGAVARAATGGGEPPAGDGTGTGTDAGAPAAADDAGDDEVNYYEDHPRHIASCATKTGGYDCGKGATIQFNISPRKAANGDPLLELPDTEFTVTVDGSEQLRNTVSYKQGESVTVKVYGVLPGSHTFTVSSGDTGKWKYKSATYDGFTNWPVYKDGKKVGGTVGQTGSFSLPNTYNWDKFELEVWAFPAYEEQTTTIAATTTFKDYTAAEKDAIAFDVALYDGDGKEVAGQRKTFDKSNNWSGTWKDLPYGTYKVVNLETGESLDGASPSFTMRKPSDDITVKATVSWPGVADKDIPQSVKLELLDSDGKVVDTQTVSRLLGNWSYTWTVKRDEYTVRQKETPAGMATTYDREVIMARDAVEWSVVNSPAASRSVYLTWEGFTTPPVQSVQVALLDARGAQVAVEALTAANGWSFAWDGLDPDGAYSVAELTTGAWTAYVQRTAAGWRIVNQATMGVTVSLTWSGYSEGALPVDTVYVQLYDGAGRAVGAPVALTAMRGWKYTWNDLPVDEYSVYETTTGNWRAEYSGTGGQSGGTGGSGGSTAARNQAINIKNVKTDTGTVSVKVVWSGWSDGEKPPVDYVRMVLLDAAGNQYGNAAQVRGSAGWTYTWTDLPQGEYTVEQTTTGNWRAEYKQSGTAWTVTNSRTDNASVTAKVTWAGFEDESDHPDTVVLKLTQVNGSAGSAAASGVLGTASKSSGWSCTWSNLEEGGLYQLEEVTTGGWTVEYSQAATGKTQTWTVKNTKSAGASGGSTSVGGTGTLSVLVDWSAYGDPPVDQVSVQLVESTGAIVGTTAIGKATGWKGEFRNLDASKSYSVVQTTQGDWSTTVTAAGGSGSATGWVIRNARSGVAIGPAGGGTSAAGDGGGTVDLDLGGTSMSNPPKTGDGTASWAAGSVVFLGAAAVLAWKRRRIAA